MKKIGLRCLTVVALLGTGLAYGEEESIDLDSVEEAAPPPAHAGGPGFKIMGRVDLSVEFTKREEAVGDRGSELKNNHFFLFLRADPNEKVSFMGEFVNQSFFFVNYAAKSHMNIKFGKIMVPFGDTSQYHHFYGGTQEGTMFPLIWASHGVDLEFSMGSSELEAYVVNGFGNDADSGEPVLNGVPSSTKQAGGLRYTTRAMTGFTAIISAYYQEWQPGKPMNIFGLDLASSYGAISAPVLKDVRLSMGMAQSQVKKVETEDYKTTGSYVLVATKLIPGGEARIRAGDYIDDSRNETANDTHSASAGWQMDFDGIKLLTEYIWNYESKDEVDNDMFRMMASLDF